MRQAINLDKAHNLVYQHDLLDIMLASGDYKGAVAQTDSLIADNHHDYWIYSDRGIARAGAGDKATAAGDFDQALKEIDLSKDFDAARDVILKMGQSVGYDQAIARVQPHVAAQNRWRILAVDLHIANADWAGAVAALEPLLAKPDALPADARASVLQKAGLTYQMAGQFDKAHKAYEDLLKIQPNDVSVLNNIAYLLAVDMKNPVQAKAYSQQAYDSQIRNGLVNPGVADTHGWVLTLCGGNDAGVGLTILDRIVRDHPDFLEARYHLGMAYLRKKDSKMAEQQLAAAMNQVQQLENQHQTVDSHLKDEINQGLRQAREQNGTRVDSAG
jgi:Flp pilus assembly protein TadD